jgi:ATP-dependent helicase/nuclease subunit A
VVSRMNYTPQQRQAIESTASYICVDAGAGSGKTRVLVDRIVHLLKTGQAKLEEIVAITFTEKAALEMKERLRRAFRECAPKDDPDLFSFWRDLERRVDTAHITTIHSFCARLLREHALFLKLDPDFGLLSDGDNVVLVHDAIDRTMHQLLEKGDRSMVRLAAEYDLRTLRGLCHRLLRRRDVVDRIRRRDGMKTPKSIVATWTSVVEEERRRSLEQLGKSPVLMAHLQDLRGYEGLCDDPEEKRESWRVIMVGALEAIRSGLPASDVVAALHGIAETPVGKASYKKWSDRAMYDALGKRLTKVKNFAQGFLAEDVPDPKRIALSAQLTSDLLALEVQVREAFQSRKLDQGKLDFDDLVLEALNFLRTRDTLRQQTARRMNFLMLDEFQDTDGAQLEIAKLLHKEEGGPALFIVGDPKQSIYYFRGAEVEIFQQERDAAVELVRLDKNFRSLPDVMGFINHFFQHSGQLCAVEDYQPMAVQRERAGGARVGFILSDKPEDHEGKWLAGAKRTKEAAQIAAQIQRICDPGSRLTVADEGTGESRRPAYGDVVLLFRAMSNVGIYEEALRKAGIPYALVAGAGFYKRQEIIDIVNILKVLLDPWDEYALLAWLRGPAVALSDEDILRLTLSDALTNAVFNKEIPEGLAHPERLLRARTQYAALHAHLGDPVPELLQWVLELTGLEAVVLSQYLGLQKASNIRKLLTLAREQAGSGTMSLRQFVRYVEEVHTYKIREGEAGLQPESQGAVTLMTMHKSKGLEFPVVILPDLGASKGNQGEHTLHLHRHLGMALQVTGEDGTRTELPLNSQIKQRIKEDEGDEAARLLYVALTRARDMLYLCGDSKDDSGSWFSAFNSLFGLGDLEDGATFAGDTWTAEVLRDIPEAEKRVNAITTNEKIDKSAIERRLAPVNVPDAQKTTISVSRLLSLMHPVEFEGEERSDEEFPRIERDNTYAMDRGTLVHRMFELWEFSGDTPDIRRLVRDARMGLDVRETLCEDLGNIAMWFKTEVLQLQPETDAKRVAQASRLCTSDESRVDSGQQAAALGEQLRNGAKLLREAPFSLRIGETIVNGTIDLALSDGTLIDFKTGRMKDATAARYEKQLLLYAAALQSLTGTTPKVGLLVYVDAQECVEVAFDPERIASVLDEAHAALAKGVGHSCPT